MAFMWRGILGLLAILAVTACVGVTSRGDFQQIIAARGGGVSTDLPLDGIAAIADELGTTSFDVRTFVLNPDIGRGSAEVIDPDNPENVDRFRFGLSGIVSVQPVVLTERDRDRLADETFSIDAVAFERIEEMARTAIDQFGIEGGSVSSISVNRRSEGIRISISLESDRATGYATFTAAGEFLEVERV